MLEQFFAEQADPTRAALVQKIKGVLDEYIQGSISHVDFLQMVHQECILVQSALEEVPDGPQATLYEEGLSLYLEALYLLGQEVESQGSLSSELEMQIFDLAARADQKMADFEFEASREGASDA